MDIKNLIANPNAVMVTPSIKSYQKSNSTYPQTSKNYIPFGTVAKL